MKLQTKFNLAMLGAFVVGLSLAAGLAYKLSYDGARRDVLQQAALMASEGDSASAYTDQEVAPLLAKAGAGQFAPQMIPFLATQDVSRRLQKEWPDYSYRDAALNPTNPADRAAEWEAKIIDRFRADPGLRQIVSQRDTPAGPVLSVSKPIRVSDAACLTCHSTPDKAPAAMVTLYGADHGFGWTPGEIVGAQIVSAPMKLPLAHARQSFLVFVGGLAFVFLVTMVAVNLLLRAFVVRPVAAMADAVGTLSEGRAEGADLPVRGKDEIAALAGALNRLRRRLTSSGKLPEE